MKTKKVLISVKDRLRKSYEIGPHWQGHMLKLNRITDYAVVVLAQMAREPQSVVTAPQLSAESNVPQPTVAKLLKELARAGVLTSHRGASGGYSLSRAPEEIDMLEIVGALEGPVALTACVETSEDDCTVESLCPMRGNWNKVNTAIRTALESVTLADMVLQGINLERPSERRELAETQA